jgi:hypothetical protein
MLHQQSGSSAYSKSEGKKKQSQIKGLVQEFGKLIISWRHTTKEIEKLIRATSSILGNYHSIDKYFGKPSIGSRGSLQADFPDLHARLRQRLTVSIEGNIKHMQQFWTRLGDIHSAIVKASMDASRIILNEDPDVYFCVNDIFTPDHLLQITSMQIQYSLEYERKFRLIQKLNLVDYPDTSVIDRQHVQSDVSSMNLRPSKNRVSEYETLQSGFSQTLRCWGDLSEISFIIHDNVEAFMLTNNVVDST